MGDSIDTRSEPRQIRTTDGNEQGEVAQRSKWQAVLLEAGGLSAALSEDSMQSASRLAPW